MRLIDSRLARRIRLMAFDVDGVLTDNAVFIGMVNGARVEFKRFDIQDGLAIGLLQRLGVLVAWVSGRHSDATTLRAAELKIEELIQEPSAQKVLPMTAMLNRRGIGWDEVAFVGDDLADLPVFRRVALPIAVANAVEEVRQAASYTTQAPGGKGAVREAIEQLLRAQGRWDEAVQTYLADRGEK